METKDPNKEPWTSPVPLDGTASSKHLRILLTPPSGPREGGGLAERDLGTVYSRQSHLGRMDAFYKIATQPRLLYQNE